MGAVQVGQVNDEGAVTGVMELDDVFLAVASIMEDDTVNHEGISKGRSETKEVPSARDSLASVAPHSRSFWAHNMLRHGRFREMAEGIDETLSPKDVMSRQEKNKLKREMGRVQRGAQQWVGMVSWAPFAAFHRASSAVFTCLSGPFQHSHS